MEFDALDNDDEEVGPKRSIEGWILFVTNIQEESTEDDVATPFSDFGTIKNIHMNIDRRTGYLKGYALIEYETFSEAKNALNALNGKQINGQAISVSWSFVREPLKDKRSRFDNFLGPV
jgi:RNA-binding protein 8A